MSFHISKYLKSYGTFKPDNEQTICDQDNFSYLSKSYLCGVLTLTIKSIFNSSNTKISTSKVTTIENLATLSKLMKEWKDKAKANYKADNSGTSLSELKKSIYSIDRIMQNLHTLVRNKRRGKTDNHVVYVASVNKTIQGIAIKILEAGNYKKKARVYIKDITTHPDNIADPVNKIRGIGTAIMRHIVSDMTQSGEADHLYLHSLATSVSFYEKIGLDEAVDDDSDLSDSVSELDESDSDIEIDKRDSDSDYKVDRQEFYNKKKMILPSEKIYSFLSTHSSVAQIASEEDTFTQQQSSQ